MMTEKHHKYPTLLSPLHAGRLRMKNRTVFPGHQTLYSDKAIIGEKMIGYYAERARGGVGAIVIEGAAVHDTTMKFPNYLAAHRPEITKSLDALAAALDPYDCRPILQIAHSGSRMSSHDSRLPLWAPSDVRSAISPEIPHAMTKREIRDVISGYVAAARNVARSGIAGIEVHSAHEYLLGQFLSPLNNKRTDEYGGSFDNRIRLLVQVLEAVRTELGDSKVMGIRINGSDLTPGGPQNEEYVQIAAAVCALSDLDYVSVSAGTSRNNEMIVPPMDVPQGVYIEYAANIRAAIPVPVFGVGRVKRPEHAEQILASGRIDVIAEARALIADPHWVRKLVEERDHEIRPCIGCNQGCFGYLYTNRPITCAVNPEAGLESAMTMFVDLPRVKNARHVVVIGGGPAGMEAALSAAALGDRVTLFEASNRLGGQLRAAGAYETRRELLDIVDHQERELSRLGVDVRLNSRATTDEIRALGADRVIIATGSRPLAEPIPTDGSVPVVAPIDAVLDPGKWRDKDVVVVDGVGHFQAYAPAMALADAGARVVIVTGKLHAAGNLDQASMMRTLQTLGKKGIPVHAQTAVTGIARGAVRASHVFSSREVSFSADAVIAAVGNEADDALGRALDAADVDVVLVGDCAAPRTVLEAIREGRAAARGDLRGVLARTA
jgi:2,4-dienoyl-CoA reductase-like NADH-dependent reductase (Old Yellow Enzyme family)/thioredoxin reductase